MNEMTTVPTNAVARVYKTTGCAVVDNTIADVAKMTASIENNSKELAKCFYDLRKAHADNKGTDGYTYADSKFPEMIDSVFKGVYSGATAHKYAKTFETFALSVSVYNERKICWKWFTMGKLNSLKSILTIEGKKSKEKWENNVNVFNFLAKFGNKVNDEMQKKLDEWTEVNAKVEAMREKARAIFDEDTIKAQFPYIGEKPIVAPAELPLPTDSTDDEVVKAHADSVRNRWNVILDFGGNYLSRMSDSDFKTEVDTFIKDQKPAEPEKEEKEEEKKNPESPEKVLARLIADMGAYAETFGDKVPAWYTNTFEKLKARQAK